MQVLIIHCHPDPASFIAELTRSAAVELRRQGHTVEISDLYAEDFDPLEGPRHYPGRDREEPFAVLNAQRWASESGQLPPEVVREIKRLEWAELVIFQFPLWWHALPAMLKGWFDRVMVYGGLYTGSQRYDRGHFCGRRALSSVTTGGPASTFAHNGRGGDIELLTWPLHYSLHYMGFSVLPGFYVHGVQGGGRDVRYLPDDDFTRHLAAERQRWIERLRGLDREQLLRFPGWDDWDAEGRLKPGVEGHDYFIRARP